MIFWFIDKKTIFVGVYRKVTKISARIIEEHFNLILNAIIYVDEL